MNSTPDSTIIDRRVRQAMIIDGVLDILLGLYLVIISLILLGNRQMMPLSALLFFVFKPLHEKLKARYVYPRIGFVRPDIDEKHEARGIGVSAAVFVVILTGSLFIFARIFGVSDGESIWMRYVLPPFTGFMIACGPLWMGQTYGVRRGYLLALFFLFSGFMFAATGIATGFRAIAFMALSGGIISLTAGSVLFVSFIRKYPPMEAA